ncbi:MAG: hypothetical protein HY898_07120 [Deltaproteobacteria bacterium]|nr:hypothetical protein [Deltaproteobacteria bacterium]
MLMVRILVVAAAALAVTGCCKLPTSSESKENTPVTSTAKPKAGDRIYNMDFPCDNDPTLRISQIALTPTETRVTVKYRNKDRQTAELSTAPPGQPETFFIEAADQTRTLELRSATGLAISPNKNKVPPGGTLEFTLIFPPIDETWSPIDLHEGKVVKKGLNYWNFTDIPLK